MSRLIDADTPIHVQIYDDMTEEWRLKETTVATALDYWADEGCPPTVDAVPVVHGRWIRDEFGSKCGACCLYAYRDKFDQPWESPYCPNCGADMRGEQE